ncbi:hypothetical protein [Jiella avicenniae]|uniref:Uncharacterized protein n=1 Tax=Jiella avicenniae TaxID=2907202 RepID=A0A9X1P2C0_9HYPH|nr:hypothetical protein [Jiella avicenniae]MCE7028474.1 hypothetical protein [Jiella avicenniae]
MADRDPLSDDDRKPVLTRDQVYDLLRAHYDALMGVQGGDDFAETVLEARRQTDRRLLRLMTMYDEVRSGRVSEIHGVDFGDLMKRPT